MSTLIYEESAVRGPHVRIGASFARLLRLHLMSRRVPAAVIALLLCAPLLQWSISGALGQGDFSGARDSAEQLSLLVETAAAAVVGAALHGPFGESERTAGRRLPWLRLATALLLTAVALGAVYVGVLGTRLPVGEFAALRDTAGMIGISVLCTVIIGGQFGWVGPVAYWVVGAYAFTDHWQTPWTWPARPGADGGAALCAFGFLAASLLAITVIGPRQHSRD